MNPKANYIKNRLSLRAPQAESLAILEHITDLLSLKKNAALTEELEKLNRFYPTLTSFERDFPSVCFTLATGVGKTRLMGAFIAYLCLAKGLKNFFVLAPNLTIYNKLMIDFSDSTHPKYVFQGIGEFVHSRPLIITGDNYDQLAQGNLYESDIHLNIFNISKLNAETRGGKVPRIKRLSEILGESYFNYLAEKQDMVLLMDESHHYRADRGLEVLNELSPVLGLELTATPQVEKGGKAVKFKNVVFEYSLAKAIQDGFVKQPAVATRKDFLPDQYTPEELDRIKLEDGIRLHEETKLQLDIYARDNKTSKVKPFVLVVAKDTVHAAQIKEMIQSPDFFDGKYADKVMEIHSNQTGDEKEENINLLLTLEHPLNTIEIVIHVNMLKEGWDVTNLYTIVPLRTAASVTLREQTIGRGLRLPYRTRTGVRAVDTLTIVAHDKFQEIVDAANLPDSIIRKEHIITIDSLEIDKSKDIVVSGTVFTKKLEETQETIALMSNPEEKRKAETANQTKAVLYQVMQEMGTSKQVKSVNDLSREEIKATILEKSKEVILDTPQQSLFADDILKELEYQYTAVVTEFSGTIIEIPRITIQPKGDIKSWFEDFDLDTSYLELQPYDEQIVVRRLTDGSIELIDANKQRAFYDTVENMIISELMNFPEIDYDEDADLLYKLAGQAIAKFRSYLSEENDVIRVVKQNKNRIAEFIYKQMMPKFRKEESSFEEPIVSVKAYTRIEEHNYTKYSQDQLHSFRETITPTSLIPSLIFSGFTKACHTYYKFDSKTEKDFSIILEQDDSVIKWLRPAHNQFKIFWDHNSKQYRPDFVVETEEGIYMVETKKQDDILDEDVQGKMKAAKEYCKYATQYTSQNGGKPWKYVLIPHSDVKVNMTFEHFVKHYSD